VNALLAQREMEFGYRSGDEKSEALSSEEFAVYDIGTDGGAGSCHRVKHP